MCCTEIIHQESKLGVTGLPSPRWASASPLACLRQHTFHSVLSQYTENFLILTIHWPPCNNPLALLAIYSSFYSAASVLKIQYKSLQIRKLTFFTTPTKQAQIKLSIRAYLAQITALSVEQGEVCWSLGCFSGMQMEFMDYVLSSPVLSFTYHCGPLWLCSLWSTFYSSTRCRSNWSFSLQGHCF